MNWYSPHRIIEECLYRLIATLLAVVILVGGIYPAIYGNALPHQHLFLGGQPPADWENHPHDRPWLPFLDTVSDSGTPTHPSPPRPGLSHGAVLTAAKPGPRVVSIYVDPSVIVLTLLLFDAVVPILGVYAPGVHSEHPILQSPPLIVAEPRPPLPHPPRLSGSSNLR